MIISKKTKYFINKSRNDQKKAKRVAYRVQQYNNAMVDEYVESVDEGNPKKIATAMIWADLTILNKPSVYRNYQRIINSKYTSNEAFHKMLIRNKANKDLNRIVESQVNRVAKNLDFVEKTLKNYEMPLKEYQKILDEQKNRSVANRMKIMEDVAKAREDIMRSEGLNIPSSYSYRDLDALTENLHMQSQSASEWEEAVAMNEEAVANGKSEVYTKKQWQWTGEGKTTRHREMGNYPTIDFNDSFQVEDENSGTIDQMLYPRDLDASIENVAGCVCQLILL